MPLNVLFLYKISVCCSFRHGRWQQGQGGRAPLDFDTRHIIDRSLTVLNQAFKFKTEQAKAKKTSKKKKQTDPYGWSFASRPRSPSMTR